MRALTNRVEKFVTSLVTYTVFVFMVITVCATLLQVVFRYVLRRPLMWSEELARFAFAWLTFSGAALASKARAHIQVDYFADKLPRKLKAVASKIAGLATCIFLIIVIYYAIPLSRVQRGIKSIALGIPLSYFTFAIVVGAAGMLIYTVSMLLGILPVDEDSTEGEA